MYSKNKAEKLIREFAYLEGENYYPFGKKGKPLKITGLKTYVPIISRSSAEYFVHSTDNPNYGDEKDAKIADGDNWQVKIIVSDEEDKLVIDLEDVLSIMNINHNIDELLL